MENVNWQDTPILKRGLFNFRQKFDDICGELVFGRRKSHAKQAYENIKSFMERACTIESFCTAPPGTIITTPPTEDECVEKLRALKERAYEYYSNMEQTEVTDHWARDAHVREGYPLNPAKSLHKRILERSSKRFSGKELPTEKQVRDLITDNAGLLAEGHVVAFLNSYLTCPECGVKGQIGWCDGITRNTIDAFRDAVCTNCRKNGVVTLFEIKTRWERHAHEKGTYGGSFVAINTLLAVKANVYLVMVSRDTGHVRLGKINMAEMRGNKNWLYALQEGFTWGGPFSYITCDKGMLLCSTRMPILTEILTPEFCRKVAQRAMEE